MAKNLLGTSVLGELYMSHPREHMNSSSVVMLHVSVLYKAKHALV